jgi:mannose-6-phosphate isomerase-like protein (cupin superfamily)
MSDVKALPADDRTVISGNEAEVAQIPRPGRVVRHFVGHEEGARLLSSGVVVFPPDTDSIPHMHTDNEEILYVLSGHGALVCDGQTVPLRPGEFVFIPPGIKHYVHNPGEEEIKFFYVFSPPAIVGTW